MAQVLSFLEIYEEGRLGYIDGLSNPYSESKQKIESAAFECGWMDARRSGLGHMHTVQRIRGEAVEPTTEGVLA